MLVNTRYIHSTRGTSSNFILYSRTRWVKLVTHSVSYTITGWSCHKYYFCCDKHVFCRDKSILTTKFFLSGYIDVCRDKHETNHLSRQPYFVATKTCFVKKGVCRYKSNLYCDKFFLSRQMFVVTNVLSRQTYIFFFCFVVTNTCMWQQTK